MTPIDLTHTFELPMPVSPGDAVPEFLATASIKADGVVDTQVTTGLHVGTHIDAPGHMIEGGKLLSDYPVERFVGRGVLVDARRAAHMTAELLREVDLQSGDMVLVLTGWSKWFGSSLRAERSNLMRSPRPDESGTRDDKTEKDYFANFPVPEESFAERLVEAGVSMVGFDTPSPDEVEQDPENLFPLHHILLGGDVLIAENVNHLDQLANVKTFEVTALPTKFALTAAPARIVARIK